MKLKASLFTLILTLTFAIAYIMHAFKGHDVHMWDIAGYALTLIMAAFFIYPSEIKLFVSSTLRSWFTRTPQ